MAAIALLLAFGLAAQQASVADAMQLAAGGDFAGAERILSQLAASEPKNAEYRYRLGLVLLRQKKLPEAGRELQAAAALAPRNAMIRLAAAQVHLQRGQLDESFSSGLQAVQLAPGDATVARLGGALYAQLGQAYRGATNPAKAVSAWQESIRLDPDQPGPYLDLAQMFLDHRTPEPAMIVLSHASKKFPQNAVLLRQYGLARYATGDASGAIEVFLRVIDLAPDAEESYSSLETLLPEAGGHLQEIRERLHTFVARHASNAVGLYLLALVEPLESEKLLRHAIQAEPRFWPAHYELHKPLVNRGEHREAANSLRRAISLNPAYAPARYALAQVHMKLGDREAAAAERRIHHELLLKERRASELRQAQMQRLPYTLTPQ